MIKVPATPEGIPAIRALTAAGVSVNVTLIFSLLQYEEVLEAYLAGLEDRVAAGGSLAGLASVASFFVSRVDSACDKLLAEKAAKSARRGGGPRARRCSASSPSPTPSSPTRSTSGTSASPRWTKLAAAGAHPQRLLWASTGTKDPRYSDIYVRRRASRPPTPSTRFRPPRSTRSWITAAPSRSCTTDLEARAPDGRRSSRALGLDLARVCHSLLADGVTVVLDLDEHAHRRHRRAPRGAARGGRRPPARRRCPSRCAPPSTPRWRVSAQAGRRQAPLGRRRHAVLFRPRPREVDQEPPRLAALARAHADQGGRAGRLRATKSRRRDSPTPCCSAWAEAPFAPRFCA